MVFYEKNPTLKCCYRITEKREQRRLPVKKKNQESRLVQDYMAIPTYAEHSQVPFSVDNEHLWHVTYSPYSVLIPMIYIPSTHPQSIQSVEPNEQQGSL